jgi:hypothetical protein
MAEAPAATPDAALDRIAQLAALRTDAEVLHLLQSRPDLAAQPHDLRVTAAALRQANRQFAEQFPIHGASSALAGLVELADGLMRHHPLAGKFTADPATREYLGAAIDWHETLRETPYVARFWHAMDALSRADLGALFDVRSRLVGRLAALGLETALPGPLDAFVMGFLRRPYLLTEPHDVLDLLAYGIQRYGATGRLREIVGDLLPDWCHYFAIAQIHLIEGLRHLYRLRDRVHGQLDMAFRTDPLWSRRFGTPWLSAALGLVRLGQRPFFRSPAFVKLFGMRRWLQATRDLMAWLERHPFDAARAPAPGAVLGSAADVLVTRAQGGLGDIMTMRPGLLDLARRHPRGRVVFATRSGHFALFSADDPIELVDIEAAAIDHRSFGRWYDLSVCPGARVETAEYPKIRTQRIDIFAGALGARLDAGGRLRPIHFTPALDDEATAFLRSHGPADRRTIGIQLRSADTYKDYPALLDVARALAAHHRVFVFDSRAIPRRDDDGFIAVENRPLGLVMAIAAKLDAIVTPDSVLLHLAGTNGVPCVAIFGPTDGKLHEAAYPSVRIVDLRAELPCIPCWRSEITKCGLSESYRSVCLHELPQPAVLAAVEAALAGTR